MTACGLLLLFSGAAMAYVGIRDHAWFTLFWAFVFMATGVDLLVFVASLVSLRRQAAREAILRERILAKFNHPPFFASGRFGARK